MSQAADAKDEPVAQRDAERPASPAAVRAEEGTPAKEEPAALTAADLSSVPPATSGSSLLVAGLALSALLHVGLLVYLQPKTVENVGPGGVQLEAISVDLVPLSEWRVGAPNLALDFGTDAIDQDRKDKTDVARREVTETPPAEGLIKPTDGTSELAAAEIIKPDPIHEHRKEEAAKEKPEKLDKPDSAADDHGHAKKKQEAANFQAKGGSSVGATPGQVSRYALSIREVLNRNRPQHLGPRGRGVVAFGLTDTGEVRYAQIERSSGVKGLDDAILATVWKTQFPSAPHGMTDKERSYTVPFEFR